MHVVGKQIYFFNEILFDYILPYCRLGTPSNNFSSLLDSDSILMRCLERDRQEWVALLLVIRSIDSSSSLTRASFFCLQQTAV